MTELRSEYVVLLKSVRSIADRTFQPRVDRLGLVADDVRREGRREVAVLAGDPGQGDLPGLGATKGNVIVAALQTCDGTSFISQ